MKSRRFVFAIIGCVLALIIVFGAATVIIDPFFHYHAPLKGLSYDLDSERERYLNYGILEHFDYDAIITGSSMTQNFKSSEFDSLFGVNSVKTSFSGAYNKEISTHLAAALESHPDVKYVVDSLDFYNWLADKDAVAYDDYPDYLYDDRLLNDVKYVFNNDVLWNESLHTVHYTLQGKTTTPFDSYSNWMSGRVFGKEAVLSSYGHTNSASVMQEFTESDRVKAKENIDQNFISIIEQHPDTQFNLFVPPYSICWFDEHIRDGSLQKLLDAMEYEVSLLLLYENVHLFCFFDAYDVICDLSNYRDTGHYGEKINSQILKWMKDDTYAVSQDDWEERCDQIKAFYKDFDYESIYSTP